MRNSRPRGFAGREYTIVRDCVRRLRPAVQTAARGSGSRPGREPRAQMDYAMRTMIDFTETGKRRVHRLFKARRAGVYSRRQYVRFVESQDMETTLREHVRAFEHLGGAAAVCTCTTTPLKVVVTQHDEAVLAGLRHAVSGASPRTTAFAPWAACSSPRRGPNEARGGRAALPIPWKAAC